MGGPVTSCRVEVWVPLEFTHVTCTVDPGLCTGGAGPGVSAESTDCPFTAVITEPVVMPALAAGVFGTTPATNAPELTPRPLPTEEGSGRTFTPRSPAGPMMMLELPWPARTCCTMPSASVA